jgi:hypothetical protein
MKCGKRTYNRMEAIFALARIKPNKNRRESRMYWCKNCLAWHLSSKKYSNRRIS